MTSTNPWPRSASSADGGVAVVPGGKAHRECLDHVLVLSEAQLRRILSAYADYYNRVRTHLALDNEAPLGRPVR